MTVGSAAKIEQHHAFRQARLARDVRFDGLFFVAVKTTGIFCRPICPANLPKEENVEYFPIAHLAMQAGYRPCLRCRPDSAPDSYSWKGVETTVERGLKLLKTHPHMALTELAEKLGISDRYFRALFQKRVGISPKQYQLFEKVLFAKQLLHQTRLSVEQIAQASGFNSSRRLQQQLKKTTGLTPLQIRRKDKCAGAALTLNLSCTTPYNWVQVRDFLAVRSVSGMEWVTDNSYGRCFYLEGKKGYFEAQFQPVTDSFEVKVELQDISLLKKALLEIKRVLDIETDVQVIEAWLAKAGLNQKQICTGLRLPGVWDLFEAGCRAVLGQQVSIKAAIKLLSQLVHQLGERDGAHIYFPDAKRVAEADLTFLKMPNSRRQTLADFAVWCAAQPVQTDPDEWLAIKGIGPWTAAYARMRGLSDPDVFLQSDLVVKKQLTTMRIDAGACQPWRSYLTFQLWNRANAN